MASEGEAGKSPRRFFVAIHVGIGYHSPSNEKALKSTMKRACIAASAILSKGSGQCIDAVVVAIQVLEIAALLAKGQMVGSPLLGHIPPIFLADEGACMWGKSKGIALPASTKEADEWLIIERARAQWTRCKSMVDASKCKTENFAEDNSSTYQSNELPEDRVMDTVGVICVDTKGHVASGASGGGIAMKVMGIFLEIVKQGLENFSETTFEVTALEHFTLSVAEDSSQCGTDSSAGILVVQLDIIDQGKSSMLKAVEIAAAYTSLSFGVGYFGSSMERPKVSILRSTTQQNWVGIDQFGVRIDLLTS